MAPAKDDSSRVATINETFCKQASSVVVAFKAAANGRAPDPDHRGDRQNLRMCFKVCYEPPVVTFRFNISIFGYSHTKKKEKTTLYFDVPRHHILSLEQTNHIEISTVSELGQDDLPRPAGNVTRIRFLLKRPGNLVQPIREHSLKPASQRILASMTLLATALEFVLLMPHTTLSKQQIHCLQQAISSPISLNDQAQQEKEHDWWLGALYGGTGGKLLSTLPATASPTAIDSNDMSTASESGDTVAMATPPAYRRLVTPGDQSTAAAEINDSTTASDSGDDITTACPPPYMSLSLEEDNTTSTAEMTGKRLRNSRELDTKRYRRRLDSELESEQPCFGGIASGLSLEKQKNADVSLPLPVALIISKFEEVLEKARILEQENGSLRAEILALRESQCQMNVRLEEMIDWNTKYVKRTQDLENESADLGAQITNLRQCHDEFEERQAELEDRQEKTEEKCDAIEVEIIDQVHTALKNSLISALEAI